MSTTSTPSFKKKNSSVFSVLWMLSCLLCSSLLAFPPAPSYTIYGIVRDQLGQTINSANAELILLKDGVEIGSTPVISGLQIDQNYELNIRIDQDRGGTTIYTENAIAAEGQFSLVVKIDGTLYYPIEVSGTLTAGNGGERVRLDLNLGEDSDNDGLADVWEQWQLYQAGYFPDNNGVWDLSLINGLGDFDNDGQSNSFEYIAGTFAGDATERFDLKITEKLEESIRFEFYEITGKVYTIESSTDMKTWTREDFSVGELIEENSSYQASDVGVTSAFATPDSSTEKFYRLSVR